MERIVEIEGRKIKLKVHGNVPTMYMQQFGTDLFADVHTMENNGVSFGVFNNFLWTLAKAADKELLPPDEWNETFTVFPIVECLDEVMEIFEKMMPVGKLKNLQVKRTKKR